MEDMDIILRVQQSRLFKLVRCDGEMLLIYIYIYIYIERERIISLLHFTFLGGVCIHLMNCSFDRLNFTISTLRLCVLVVVMRQH